MARIIGGVLNIDIESIKDNIELIEPDISSNINSVDSKVDSIYKLDNKYINIEINYNNKRIVTIKNNIYLYNMILRQIGSSKEYKDIKSVIQININNYDMFKEGRFLYGYAISIDFKQFDKSPFRSSGEALNSLIFGRTKIYD